MGIYRGPGGTGDAVNDASSEALITVQAKDDALAAQAAAEAARNAAQAAQANAEIAEANAETAETNAETAATNAAASAATASSAIATTAASASAAATSASNAATSATNAANSATAAATSASNAASSASTATTQATNASNSASSAATSATNASNSASAAATSATNAANSATAAQTARTAAELAETNAETAEANAETAETNAAASASAAATSASNASTSASNAATSATNASNSASAAATSATNASNSASAAATSATNASNSATSAANSATAAAASYDSFDDRYLGPKTTDPTLDNDGNTLLVGALYFNSTTNEMRVWNGSTWLVAYVSLSGALLSTNNLSDLNNAATARDNLGVEIGVDVQAYDAQLTDIAGLTPSDNNFIVGNGTNFVTESGSTARTSLGLGSIATQDANNVAVTGGSINGTTVGASTAASGAFTSLTSSSTTTLNGTTIPANKTLVVTTDIGSTVQAYDADLAAFALKTAPTGDVVGTSDSQTLTNKTIALGSNTVSGTLAQFNTAVTDADLVSIAGSETLTNKTLTSPTINTATISGGTINNAAIGGTTPAAGSFTSLTDSGNLTFTGTGNRILGDFINGTFANRVYFQTSTPGSNTSVGALPNTSPGVSNFAAYSHADPTNSSRIQIAMVGGSDARLVSDAIGTGTALPLTMFTGGSERLRIDTSGNVGIGTSSPGSNSLTLARGAGVGVSLEVCGNGTSPGTSGLTVLQSTASDAYVWNRANSFLSLGTNNTERMRIDSSGNVMIGTTTARGRLHSAASSFNPFSGNVWATSASFTASGSFGGGLALVDGAAGYGLWAQDSGGSLIIGQGNTSGNLTERMRIFASGGVAIGNTTDRGAGALSVNGAIYTGGSYISGATDANWGTLYFPSKAGAAAAHGFLNASGSAVVTFTNAGVVNATSFSGAGTGLTGTASSLSIGGTAANVTGTVAQANGGTGFTTGYRLFQSEFTVNINANTNRTVGAYGSYASGATNTPTNSGILYNFTSGSDGSADGGQFWQDFGSNNLYLRQRWGGSYGSWLTILSNTNTGVCRAWVNFNGTGTVAIRASFNVSSITDNGGAGNYNVNFATAMPDSNYATTFSTNNEVLNISNQWQWHTIVSASAVNIRIFQGNQIDASVVTVAVFR